MGEGDGVVVRVEQQNVHSVSANQNRKKKFPFPDKVDSCDHNLILLSFKAS